MRATRASAASPGWLLPDRGDELVGDSGARGRQGALSRFRRSRLGHCACSAARELGDRLREEAQRAQSNEDLVRRFVEACRRTRTICRPRRRSSGSAPTRWSTRRIEADIAERVPPGLRRDLEHLLDETVDAGVTRFVWLRQFEPGSNSADANWLLDRLEHLRRLDFRRASSTMSPRIGSRGCAGRGNATSPTGSASSGQPSPRDSRGLRHWMAGRSPT